MQISGVSIGSVILNDTGEEFYNQTIHYPSTADSDLLDAVNDAEVALETITGQAYTTTTTYTANSIKLLLFGDANMPSADTTWLTGKEREAFTIRSSGSNDLTICANRDEGLRQGLYYYLQLIGVRYYAPNTTAFSVNSATWDYFPSTNNIGLAIDEEKIADFPDTRSFFGTGGFGGDTDVDPNRDLQASWELYIRRNMYGGNIKVAGHQGEGYNAQNQAFLESNVIYMAEVDGVNGPYSGIVKVNTAYAPARQRFIDFLLQKYEERYTADPNQISAWAQSVEPADGGGHCNSAGCLAFGSISDQVFTIANEAAIAIKTINPDAYITLLAYNQHAAVPTIELESNIYVQVIPYAFQQTGLSPLHLIQAWGAKLSAMGIYDYWSIPDWSDDLPAFDWKDEAYDRLTLWNANNITGVNTESTYSHGAMGLAHYVASRLMWDVTADRSAIYEEYFTLMFGAAKAPIRNMYDRWSDGYMPSTHDLALSYRDLQDAKALTSDEDILDRIGDLGRYVRYLDLFVSWDILDNGTAKDDANEAIVRYCWDIYWSTMIHSDRRSDLQTGNYPDLRAEYVPAEDPGKGPGWDLVSQPTRADIFNIIDQGVIDYTPIDITRSNYTGGLVATGQTPVTPPVTNPTMRFNGVVNYTIEAIAGQTSYLLKHKHTTDKLYTVQLINSIGTVLEQDDFVGDDSWHDHTMTIPSIGQYTINIQNKGNSYLWLEVPNDFLMSMSDFSTVSPFGSPPLFFWVPAGHTKVAMFRKKAGVAFTVEDSTGSTVTQISYDNDRLIVMDVPSGEDGKIWTATGVIAATDASGFNFVALTFPQSFSLHHNTLLIPSDSL